MYIVIRIKLLFQKHKMCSTFNKKCGACNTEVDEKRCCSRCLQRWYCFRACQKADWSHHKVECFTREEKSQRKLIVKQTTVKECIICNKTDVKLRSCASCRSARYCSSECQKKDWSKHRIICGKRSSRPILNLLQKECQDLTVKAMRCIQIGNRLCEAYVYNNLGVAYCEIGHFYKAIEFHQKNLTISLELGNESQENTAYSIVRKAHAHALT